MNTIEWSDGKIRLLDQTKLPLEQTVLEIDDYRDLVEAIQSLRVRGAPALGVAAAYGIALAAQSIAEGNRDAFLASVAKASGEIVAARPTAVNMAWAAKRVLAVAKAQATIEGIRQALVEEACRIHREDIEVNRRIGAHGAALVPDRATVLTHCNAGSLATAGYGTALGVIRSAREAGKQVRVFATETRPLLQGARLTTWELLQDGFDVTLITDSMVGHFLASGEIDCAVVGADRIAMNGDVANKIGTLTAAVVAKEHGVPFYVAAPISTIDPATASGGDIPIEERSAREITAWGGVQTAPEGVSVANPAFDVTPSRYVSAIITEHGVARTPYGESLKAMIGAQP